MNIVVDDKNVGGPDVSTLALPPLRLNTLDVLNSINIELKLISKIHFTAEDTEAIHAEGAEKLFPIVLHFFCSYSC